MRDVATLIVMAERAIAAGRGAEACADLEAAIASLPTGTRAAAPLWSVLARARRGAGRIDAAVQALAQAAQADSDNPQAWLALAGLLMEIAAVAGAKAGAADPLPPALAALERAVALAPDAPSVRAQAAMALRYACAWEAADVQISELRALAADPARVLPVPPLIAAALIEDPALQARAIADHVARTQAFVRASLGAQSAPSPAMVPAAVPRVRSPGSRLRVGYLSADFHDHATAHLAAGLFEAHDRGRLESFGYALDRDDGSEMRTRLSRAFEHWCPVAALSDESIARRIEEDRLDVLVDLKGHTQGARLRILALRPAPVQIHYLGFPGTLAFEGIDALVADPIVVPTGDEGHFRERILRLPRCYQVNDRSRPLPAVSERASEGLPERALVLASFNQAYKLDARFVAAWLEVLAAHADAVLWLGGVSQPLARRQLVAAAQQQGIAPQRLVFASHRPQSQHLSRLALADLALDVLPYGSHTTGSDALWCGVPLLTVTGDTFAGRVGTSLVHAAGLPQLAVDSFEAYSSRLAHLVGDRAELREMRAHLVRERMRLPLFDTEGFARDFESLLENASSSGA